MSKMVEIIFKLSELPCTYLLQWFLRYATTIQNHSDRRKTKRFTTKFIRTLFSPNVEFNQILYCATPCVTHNHCMTLNHCATLFSPYVEFNQSLHRATPCVTRNHCMTHNHCITIVRRITIVRHMPILFTCETSRLMLSFVEASLELLVALGGCLWGCRG